MKIFISYSRVDNSYADEVEKVLKDNGVQYFFDRKDINWGDRIDTKIEEGIKSSDAILVLISPASLKSDWVPYEIGFAKGAGLQVLPYLVHPSVDIPGYLANKLYLRDMGELKKFISYKKVADILEKDTLFSRSIGLTCDTKANFEKLKYLKEAADEGYIPAMYDYGIEAEDKTERMKYLKMAADNGYIPAKYEYAKLL